MGISDKALGALIAFYLLNFKSLPGIYNLRVVRFFIRHGHLKEPLTGILEPHKYHSRVWFDDMDLNIHLSNSSYNKMLDYSRIELFCRLFPGWRTRHIFDMRLAQTVCFFKAEVPKFSKYTVTSRIFTWDDKWIWISSRFSIKRKVRPARHAKAIEGAAVPGSSTTATAMSSKSEKGVEEDEEDEDDIDPIDEKAHLSGPSDGVVLVPASPAADDSMADVPERLCCLAYARMVAKDRRGKTITPEALFRRMGHQEAYPGQWEEYRAFGMKMIEGMMKTGSQPADQPTVGKKLANPTRARI
ncbi:hypothetical protein DFQ26_002025 [Actinomortierella ambigua]|nr:hypothetical protein DFQ26_002025 [Actinomortierella ambigua]